MVFHVEHSGPSQPRAALDVQRCDFGVFHVEHSAPPGPERARGIVPPARKPPLPSCGCLHRSHAGPNDRSGVRTDPHQAGPPCHRRWASFPRPWSANFRFDAGPGGVPRWGATALPRGKAAPWIAVGDVHPPPPELATRHQGALTRAPYRARSKVFHVEHTPSRVARLRSLCTPRHQARCALGKHVTTPHPADRLEPRILCS